MVRQTRTKHQECHSAQLPGEFSENTTFILIPPPSKSRAQSPNQLPAHSVLCVSRGGEPRPCLRPRTALLKTPPVNWATRIPISSGYSPLTWLCLGWASPFHQRDLMVGWVTAQRHSMRPGLPRQDQHVQCFKHSGSRRNTFTDVPPRNSGSSFPDPYPRLLPAHTPSPLSLPEAAPRVILLDMGHRGRWCEEPRLSVPSCVPASHRRPCNCSRQRSRMDFLPLDFGLGPVARPGH